MARPPCFSYFDIILDVADVINREGRLIAYKYPPYLKDVGLVEQKYREDVIRAAIARMMRDAVIQQRSQDENADHSITFKLNPLFEANVLAYLPRTDSQVNPWVLSARFDLEPPEEVMGCLKDLEAFLSSVNPWSPEEYLHAMRFCTLFENGLPQDTLEHLIPGIPSPAANSLHRVFESFRNCELTRHARGAIAGGVEGNISYQDKVAPSEQAGHPAPPERPSFTRERSQLSRKTISSGKQTTAYAEPSSDQQDLNPSSSESGSSGIIEISHSVLPSTSALPSKTSDQMHNSLRTGTSSPYSEQQALSGTSDSRRDSEDSGGGLAKFFERAKDLYPHDDVTTFCVQGKQCTCGECSNLVMIRRRTKAFDEFYSTVNPAPNAGNIKSTADGKRKIEDISGGSTEVRKRGCLEQGSKSVQGSAVGNRTPSQAIDQIEENNSNQLQPADQSKIPKQAKATSAKRKQQAKVSGDNVESRSVPFSGTSVEAMKTPPAVMGAFNTVETMSSYQGVPTFMLQNTIELAKNPPAAMATKPKGDRTRKQAVPMVNSNMKDQFPLPQHTEGGMPGNSSVRKVDNSKKRTTTRLPPSGAYRNPTQYGHPSQDPRSFSSQNSTGVPKKRAVPVADGSVRENAESAQPPFAYIGSMTYLNAEQGSSQNFQDANMMSNQWAHLQGGSFQRPSAMDMPAQHGHPNGPNSFPHTDNRPAQYTNALAETPQSVAAANFRAKQHANSQVEAPQNSSVASKRINDRNANPQQGTSQGLIATANRNIQYADSQSQNSQNFAIANFSANPYANHQGEVPQGFFTNNQYANPQQFYYRLSNLEHTICAQDARIYEQEQKMQLREEEYENFLLRLEDLEFHVLQNVPGRNEIAQPNERMSVMEAENRSLRGRVEDLAKQVTKQSEEMKRLTQDTEKDWQSRLDLKTVTDEASHCPAGRMDASEQAQASVEMGDRLEQGTEDQSEISLSQAKDLEQHDESTGCLEGVKP